MGLRDILIKKEYRSLIDDVIKDFYVPLLGNAVLYQRAVGFFSSSALTMISKGIEGLVNNNGKIQIIASPKLSITDIEEIRKGYELRKVIENSLIRELDCVENQDDLSQLSYIARLVADGILDIKIAFFTTKNEIAMYHEKMGLIKPLKDGRFKFIKVSELNDVINNHKAKNGPKPKKRPTLELPDSKLKAAESSKEIQEQEPDTISNGTLPAKIKNRKEFVKGMIVPVCDLDKTTSTSVYEIANAFRNITGNDMTWSEAKGIMNNLCIENHDIKHRDFSSTEFSVKLTMSISEGQKKLKAKQIISDIKTYGEEIAKRKWNIDDAFIEINCKETCK